VYPGKYSSPSILDLQFQPRGEEGRLFFFWIICLQSDWSNHVNDRVYIGGGHLTASAGMFCRNMNNPLKERGQLSAFRRVEVPLYSSV